MQVIVGQGFQFGTDRRQRRRHRQLRAERPQVAEMEIEGRLAVLDARVAKRQGQAQDTQESAPPPAA